SSLPEICGKAAVMVNPYDINDIANGLEKVMRETKIRNTLKEKGLAWVKNFSWEKAANQTIKVYQNVYQENK
ncbi:glycosyltransferase family 1 protein, partial [Candidatus Shapirobacteria bacterium CG10_big_fil_rev_8_21_14_0_10_38_14]